jgi:O-antigen/teichoic acid export membrane protein
MLIKEFLLDNRKSERDSYIWNMFGSMLMAFQSVIMLMILTRTVGLAEAGIFTIANANANLFVTIGKYGMRYFQVSDVKNQFLFVDYRMARIITSIIMLIVSGVFVIYSMTRNGYTLRKSLIIFLMCLFKVVDVIEDVYHGLYQKENRLDIAAKAMSLRLIVTIIVFGASVIISKNLLLSLIVSTILTGILFIILTGLTYGEFHVAKEKLQKENVVLLLKICFPLFAGTFLSFYIGNVPKYAIDSVLNDELQACYGFISMPVFVIGLLNGFIFNPMLYNMSILWNEGKRKRFVIKTLLQIGIILVITAICLIGAYLIGIPILSALYNTDLSSYRSELLILLLGGGFLGISGLLNTVITIIRFQDSLMWGYTVVAALALLFSRQIVEKYEMIGASILYTVLMGILCVVFLIFFLIGIYKCKLCRKPISCSE